MNQQDIDNASMLRVGTMLRGIYRIDSYLSSGGFGNTYVATNIEFNEQYAIKEFFMKGVTQRDENNTTVSVSNTENRDSFLAQREKFKKEARRLRQLNNPHIVKVHDLFEENGTAYYVMDYVDGENLAESLKRTGKPMTEQEVRDILPQILDALKAVHDAGMWHLDLKPANIMLDKSGQVKLIDFGASKQMDVQKGGATASTAISYTNGYAPREQMEQNYEKFGPWTDIYALGATLYNLLTNKRPPLPTDIDDDMSEDKHLALPMHGVGDNMKRLVLWLMKTNRMQRPKKILEIEHYLKTKESEINKEPVTDGSGSQQGTGDDTIVEPPKYGPSIGKQPDPDSSNPSNPDDDNIKDSTEKSNYLWVKIVLVVCLLLGGIWYFTNTNNNTSGKKNNANTLSTTSSRSSNIQTQTYMANGVQFKMVAVTGGTFLMGATSEQDPYAESDESPVHQVTLGDFNIGETEVTQELWQAVMGSNPSSFKGSKLPVERVSWNDCQTFITKLNQLTGQTFRLPTEAEWEYAARGGTTTSLYNGENINIVGVYNSPNLDPLAWYGGNCGQNYTSSAGCDVSNGYDISGWFEKQYNDSKGGTHPVGRKQPNAYGLYDMLGNVWEWCQDWYGSYGSSSQTNPQGPSTGSFRVNRGGSWFSGAWDCRVSNRNLNAPTYASSHLGFRLAQ